MEDYFTLRLRAVNKQVPALHDSGARISIISDQGRPPVTGLAERSGTGDHAEQRMGAKTIQLKFETVIDDGSREDKACVKNGVKFNRPVKRDRKRNLVTTGRVIKNTLVESDCVTYKQIAGSIKGDRIEQRFGRKGVLRQNLRSAGWEDQIISRHRRGVPRPVERNLPGRVWRIATASPCPVRCAGCIQHPSNRNDSDDCNQT